MDRHLLILTFVLLIGVATPQVNAADGQIIYVKADAQGANNGSSWSNAYTSLQTALAAATSGTEIWAAAGVYVPTTGASRRATFQLKNGVALYGGFRGQETFRDQRNWATNLTILSGDINQRGVRDDNVYHVVTGSNTDATAVLDGFTIRDGNANGTDAYSTGGGMLNSHGSPTVRHCIFSDNWATDGGGMYNLTGSPLLDKIIFSGNLASGGAGGLYNSTASNPMILDTVFRGNQAALSGGGMVNTFKSSPTVFNTIFSGNVAGTWGGGLHNYTECDPILVNALFTGNRAQLGGAFSCYGLCSPWIVNATFGWNRASSQGGALYNVYAATPTVRNSILWGNYAPDGDAIYLDGSSFISVAYSLVDGGWPGAGNLDADPLFMDADGADNLYGTADDDLRLRRDSPALDIGDNAEVPADTADLDRDGDTAESVPRDLDGLPRFASPAPGSLPPVDLGAYETQPFRAWRFFPLALAR
ncbi:MAG: hypothetical protein FJ011_14795 [Chloroflexi bacterium]|nr:hypothetical protein [Chloroflexota bacterium]